MIKRFALSAALAAMLAASLAMAQTAPAPYAPPPANETPQQRQTRFAAWQTANPDIDARVHDISARTAAMEASYHAQEAARQASASSDPYAHIRAQSARVAPAQRDEARTLFANAFTIWQAGDFNAAAIGFERGLDIDPANAPANFYYADILNRQGNQASAREHYQRASALGGSSAEGMRAEAALRAMPEQQAEDVGVNDPPVIWKVDQGVTTLWDCADCPELVVIPAGIFTIGSPAEELGRRSDEGPRRRITIEHAIAVGRFEVTFAQWDACVAGGGCGAYRPADQGRGRGSRPVINVSWNNAQAYVQWLSQTSGKSYRLLTEAEWEYVARAGATTPYATGASITTGQANFNNTLQRAQPVGSYPPNSFGVYDAHGNVWEMVQDCYVSSYSGLAANGAASETAACPSQVLRGGSWFSSAAAVRSAHRFGGAGAQASHDVSVGFRVARTLN